MERLNNQKTPEMETLRAATIAFLGMIAIYSSFEARKQTSNGSPAVSVGAQNHKQ